MADITPLWKASLKTVRTRNKAIGKGQDNVKNIILPPTRPKSEFATKAKDVVVSITQLREFLLEHRKAYINATSHLSSEMSSMTDKERDQIDTDAQIFMRTCSETIKAFRSEVENQAALPQVREHRERVLELLEEYLKVVCKIYSEQRAIRVKRVVDKKRIGRLTPEQRLSQDSSITPEVSSTPKSSNEPTPSKETIRLLPEDDDNDDDLSPDELLMFEQENQTLFNEMNSLVDEVKQIEGKVVEIAKLQEIFSDKVLQQEKDIYTIETKVVETTENIKEGNEEIREAIKNNAGFRVWILFFLMMCSFSLLFLDWYG
ncbi:syntaxin-18-like [Ptychodera flava]|uniref:syntaxin-18-like n=1 Tax=Ptychodera flava TaxID=63121 RepID=UPI003969EF7E